MPPNKIDPKNKSTFVVCKICSRRFSSITNSHLKTHGITKEDYILEYKPKKHELICEAVRDSNRQTKQSMIKRYGLEKGIDKWDSYILAQKHANTFEYKREKYGWTEIEYNNHKKKSIHTKETFIKRHGKTKGIRAWKKYIDKQKYAGSSLDYYVAKYGSKEGKKIYERICKEKLPSLENFIRKYGEAEGHKKYGEYIATKSNWSKISQVLFKEIHGLIPNEEVYYVTHNKEFVFRLSKSNIFLDFYLPRTKKSIEFNGDFWHCNPNIYKAEYIHPYRKTPAKKIWELERKRNTALKKEHGVDTLIVWESDFIKNHDICLDKCIKFLLG